MFHGHVWTGRILLWLPVCLLLTAPGPVRADQEAGRDSTVAVDDRPWHIRTLDRYFGSIRHEGEELEGKALDVAQQYAEYAGLPIEVIIVHPVLGFEPGPEEGDSSPEQWLENVTKPLETYTRETIIRDFLLFKPGDLLDPFDLADSERLLRSMEFIADVRIIVIKLTGGSGEIESVAVVVEPMDRFPLGVSAKIKTEDRYSLRFYTVNLFGLGALFDNEIIVNRAVDDEVGYRGRLSKDNLSGTFTDVGLEFENSYAKKRSLFLLQRQLVHPAIHVIGAGGFDQYDDRENEGVPREYIDRDAWAGYIVRLFETGDMSVLKRPMLVPAVRLSGREFLERPTVSADSNRSYHDREQYLVGLSLINNTYYKTSYFFGDGEVESMPSGFVAKVSGGYEEREFEQRPVLSGSFEWIQLRNRGDLIFARAGVGGYLDNKSLEDGVITLDGGYFTSLWGGSKWRYRLYGRLRYVLGVNRHMDDQIYLDDRAGIRGMATGQVAGNQRLVANLEARVFMPWTVAGFHTSCTAFVDLGSIGDEGEPILQEKLYASVGFGLRFRNPDLALPTFEFRILALNEVAGSGNEFQFKVGGSSYQIPAFASAKPGAPAYR